MTRKTVTALVTLAVLGLPTIAYADADASDTIIVSALRTPVDADRVPSSVTAIDQVAIERAQPLALTDALVATPGIALARAGGYGQVTTVRIRGADPSQSVVVIDGMRMADATATNGGFDFTQLFADDIARIEILRGPQSILGFDHSMHPGHGHIPTVMFRHGSENGLRAGIKIDPANFNAQ